MDDLTESLAELTKFKEGSALHDLDIVISYEARRAGCGDVDTYLSAVRGFLKSARGERSQGVVKCTPEDIAKLKGTLIEAADCFFVENKSLCSGQKPHAAACVFTSKVFTKAQEIGFLKLQAV